jgi:hypothetical protein
MDGLVPTPGVRVVEEDGRVKCLIVVWAAGERMPNATPPRLTGERAGCRRDILALFRAGGRPLTRRQVERRQREAGTPHGRGTVAKALAELTKSGELVNARDRRGYRLPEWRRRDETPDLFK